MSKKRRTRYQKIITSLRRELAKKKPVEEKSFSEPEDKKLISKKNIFSYPKETKKTSLKTITDSQKSLYNYNPELIKKDLLKTLILAVIFMLIIIFFYWFFELEGKGLLIKI